jgi:hypothetical protein
MTAKRYYRISRTRVAHAKTAYATVMGDELPAASSPLAVLYCILMLCCCVFSIE